MPESSHILSQAFYRGGRKYIQRRKSRAHPDVSVRLQWFSQCANFSYFLNSFEIKVKFWLVLIPMFKFCEEKVFCLQGSYTSATSQARLNGQTSIDVLPNTPFRHVENAKFETFLSVWHSGYSSRKTGLQLQTEKEELRTYTVRLVPGFSSIYPLSVYCISALNCLKTEENFYK